MDTDFSLQILHGCQNGDESAARELYERFVNRLIGLARSRLSDKMQARVDAEDVVQSVYRSFFRNAQAGRYHIEHSGDLWRLLASITVNKVRDQVKRHSQKKRSVDREAAAAPGTPEGDSFERLITAEPSPEAAIMLIEELEHVMRKLDADRRVILQYRLQGHVVEDIAQLAGCSEQTVRRKLKRVEEYLEQRLNGSQVIRPNEKD